MTLLEKAKTLMEILEERNNFTESIPCFNVKNQEKWVRLSDALIYLGETETQFAEEVMKYKLDLERERGLLKQKLHQFPKLPKNPNTADRINHSIECLEWLEQFRELLK